MLLLLLLLQQQQQQQQQMLAFCRQTRGLPHLPVSLGTAPVAGLRSDRAARCSR